MKKYIFLDFDGVLNTENYQAQLRADGKPGWDDYGMLFDPAAVANLKRILDAVPEVRIVVESSWKVRGLDELRLMWAERGLPGTLYDVTPTIFCQELLTADLSDPDCIRKVEGLAKGKEIRAWLRRHGGTDFRHVILDDMAEFEEELCDHSVMVNAQVGISNADVQTAIAILRQQSVPQCSTDH